MCASARGCGTVTAMDGFSPWTAVLPLLLLLAGGLLVVWGRQEQQRVRGQRGSLGGFGGPPGTTDVGDGEGFGTGPGERPLDPLAGRGKALAGLVLLAAGALLLSVALLWRVVS